MNLDILQEYRKQQGLYFLYSNQELVYIGISRNIYQRLLEHIVENKKEFNSIKTLTPDAYDSQVEFFEIFYISKKKPKYNKLMVDNFFNFFHSIPQTILKSHLTYDGYIKSFKVAEKVLDEQDFKSILVARK